MVFQLLFPIFEGEVHVQPEEANICIKEAEKCDAECMLNAVAVKLLTNMVLEIAYSSQPNCSQTNSSTRN